MVQKPFDEGEKMRRFKARMDDPGDALKQIGALMVAESQQAFKEQKFGKTSWPPRSDVNVYGIIADLAAGKKTPPSRRFQSRPALVDTGRLRSSISFKVSGDSVVVGSNLDYASVLHSGGPIESETITEGVQKALWSWLKGQGSELKKRLGWLLNKKFRGEKLSGEVPARPFVGLTKQTEEDIAEVVGVAIFEVGS